jgi:hypothetical protein
MNLNILTPRKAINKAFLKVKTNRNEIELFKTNLISLLDNINEAESEEFHKNLVSKFLSQTYYGANHFINTKGRNDLVIHNTSGASGTVGVIIEAKKPTNKAEMVTAKNINAKAFQELVLYYLRERITEKNLEIKYLVATNIYEWFIFDANLFEKEFAQNKNIVNQFIAFEEGRLSGKTTDFFYKQIAEPAINDIKHEITFTHFDIREYEKPLRNNDNKDDNTLIALYKLLSPEHLLKLPFANDSNSLDKSFYTELLHIIGLAEVKEGSKKLIQRKKEGERNAASLIESAIFQLDNLDKVSRLPKPSAFGDTNAERLFNVALELSITWINRILFLKLLEAQLIKYHKGDKSYAFLNSTKVQNFDDLNNLFFSVLARKPSDRNAEVKAHFANVPYLNSSLFEPTEIEHACLFISQLKDVKLPLLPSTVIKDNGGQKRTGELLTIEYIFEFLNAYDFASEGSEEIQEDNKRLINASVLGLIFEKINGYKDGSFFTPGFITMYMCRETIRRAVVQKFNETKNWDCTNINDLYDKIDDRNEANNIVNSLKICDPAVGSGHFLVSALNEIIAIKSDLKILTDSTGKRLKEYVVEVENDELIVTDDDGELFEYNPNNKESQRIQETLFHEKQTIIENCLFGVDLNPNSVKICRLRLWIELLKNAYYKAPDYAELETLPNIDINIKCGNSLISRYALDADIRKALARSKWSIDSYRLAVMSYRNAQSKDEKHEMERLINEIKNDFESEIATNDKRLVRINKTKGDLLALTNQTTMFERTKAEKAAWDKQVKNLTNTITTLETEIEEIRSNRIYENAFEWRFEFPEVLNDEGDFIGFDVIIGNPPYIRVQDLAHEQIDFYKENFKVAHKRIDISILFIEQGFNILKQTGILSYITSNQFLKAEYGRSIRSFIKGHIKVNIDYSKVSVFDGLATYVSVFIITKAFCNNMEYKLIDIVNEVPNNFSYFDNSLFSDEPCDFNTNQTLKQKLFNNKKVLDEIANFTYGVITGLDKAFLIPIETAKNLKIEDDIILNFIRPQNYKKYHLLNQTFHLIFPYNKDNSIINEEKLSIDFPNCYQFLSNHRTELENRQDSRKTILEKGVKWYSLMRKVDINEIIKEKIVFYDVGMHPNFILDNDNFIFGGGTSHSLTIIDDSFNQKFILGVLNSKLMEWIIYDLCPAKMGNARKFGLDYIKKLPIPIVDIKIQKIIADLVDNIISSKKEGKDILEFDSKINQIVYKLYELTEDEIKIIEGE